MTAPPTTPSIDVLDYLRAAFHQDQIAAFVTQNPDGTIVITADIGPGSSNIANTPLVGAAGNPGSAQFPLQAEPDIFPVTSDLPGPGVLLNSPADIGKFWMIAQQDNNGNFISIGAYIWYGMQFRFLPFGPVGPPGPYPKIVPQVTLLPPGQLSKQVVTPVSGGGSLANPYKLNLNLSIPQGPRGTGPPLGKMADFTALQPTVGQFVTATGQQVTFNGRVLPQWGPSSTGDLPLLPYVVPESAFLSVPNINLNFLDVILTDILNLVSGFVGFITATIGSVFDGIMTAFSGGTPTRNNSTSTVHTALVTVNTNLNALLAAIGSSATSNYPLSQIVFALNTFGGAITGTIQTDIDATANSLGLSGTGHTLNDVAMGLQHTLQPAGQQIHNLFGLGAGSSQGIPTIASFTVPPKPWPWKPLVFGQVRMFESLFNEILGIFNLQTLSVGVSVVLGWPGGVQVARGFGNSLSGVVNVIPHTSWSGNPSFAMNPYNSIGLIPAGVPGALYCNVTNDGIGATYNYNPREAQLFVLACPVTTQTQLGLATPASLHSKMSLQALSVHSP
jgi:hypothetical protein